MRLKLTFFALFSFLVIGYTFPAFLCAQNPSKPITNVSENNDPVEKENHSYSIESILGWAGLVFGIAGTVFGVFSYLSFKSEKRKEKVYEFIFDAAEKNIDKSITEEELAKKKNEVLAKEKEVNKISRHIENLQEHIRENIPIEARKAVLTDKLHTHIDLLVQTHASIKDIKKELDRFGPTLDIPPEILSAIESEISPEYYLKEKRSRYKNYLTVITTIAAVISAILPSPFDRIIVAPILLVAAPVLILLIRSYMPNDIFKKRIFKLRIYSGILFFTGVLSSMFFVPIFFIWMDNHRRAARILEPIPRDIIEIFFPLFILLPIGLICIGIMFFLKSRMLSRHNNQNSDNNIAGSTENVSLSGEG